MPGNMFDIKDITDENIWHVQHEEKNCKDSDIFTGWKERYIENPAMDAAPIPSPISNGATAPAANGKKEKNTIKNFFNLLIVFNYITFYYNVI